MQLVTATVQSTFRNRIPGLKPTCVSAVNAPLSRENLSPLSSPLSLSLFHHPKVSIQSQKSPSLEPYLPFSELWILFFLTLEFITHIHSWLFMSTRPQSSSNQVPEDSSNQSPNDSSPRTPPRVKLRKIPPIPVRRSSGEAGIADGEEGGSGGVEGAESEEEASIVLASSLGLNHIRTRSAPLPSPLRFSWVGTPSNLGGNGADTGKDGACPKADLSIPHVHDSGATEQGLFSISMYSCFAFCFRRIHIGCAEIWPNQ